MSDEHPAGDGLYCQWLWQAATVLCDGTVTCGLDDPFKLRNHGNLHASTLREILEGEAVAHRRRALTSGVRCSGCSMYEPRTGSNAEAAARDHPYPRRLIIEPSIKCNIRCNNETCNVANAKEVVLRDHNFMEWDIFRTVIDEAGPYLDELYFYNYGEPFLHPRALDMLAYAKRINPRVHVTTSTNGIMLARHPGTERIVAEGLLDSITFTIGGVDQETYERYHKAGSFASAMTGMRRLLDAKRRLGAAKPHVHWRYLVFNWNDSDACLAEAHRLREDIGVDEFRFMLTASPMDGRSLRRAPGTAGFEALRPWLAYQEGFSADSFAEAGLWGAEHRDGYGHFSWTGAKANVLATPKDGRLRMRFARGLTEAGPMPRVLIRLPWTQVEARVGRDWWEDCAVDVPAGHGSRPVPVGIEVEKTFTPMRHGQTWGDNRDIGVMISLEDIAPAPNPYRVAAASSH